MRLTFASPDWKGRKELAAWIVGPATGTELPETHPALRKGSANRGSGEAPFPLTVAGRLSFANVHVSAKCIMQTLDTSFERYHDGTNHEAHVDPNSRMTGQEPGPVERRTETRQRRARIENLHLDHRTGAAILVDCQIGTVSPHHRKDIGRNLKAQIKRQRRVGPLDMDRSCEPFVQVISISITELGRPFS